MIKSLPLWRSKTVKKKQVAFLIGIVLIVAAVVTAGMVYFSHTNVPVLNPQGQVGAEEKTLFIFTLLLSAVVVIPVFALLTVISLKYREKNAHKNNYMPNWDSNKRLEAIWWGIPIAIITILSIVTWITSHQLDPMNPLNSSVAPLKVQVVALQWKWLFIYPDQRVASVNHLVIPEKTPISFEITSDAPMNAFWIPSLGSQVYAMSGMSAHLQLIADSTGEYEGRSSNISGTHFADMHFAVDSVTGVEFTRWINNAKTTQGLTMNAYEQLAQPGVITQPATYALQDEMLYDSIIAKYQKNTDTTTTMEGMH